MGPGLHGGSRAVDEQRAWLHRHIALVQDHAAGFQRLHAAQAEDLLDAPQLRHLAL